MNYDWSNQLNKEASCGRTNNVKPFNFEPDSGVEYRLDSNCGNYALLRGVTDSPFPEDTTNKIDFKTKIDYGDMKFNNCLMYIEPRLQEYVKHKEYYGKNGITPSIGLEETYSITKSDLMNIRRMLKCKSEKNCGLIQTDVTMRTVGRPKCGKVTTSRFVRNETGRFDIHSRGVLPMKGTKEREFEMQPSPV